MVETLFLPLRAVDSSPADRVRVKLGRALNLIRNG
jgi:hypothetical protein